MFYTEQHECRICGYGLDPILDLGSIHPSAFLKVGEVVPEKVPLVLVKCSNPACGLVQLAHTVDLDSLYEKYYYQSGINSSMVKALGDIVEEARKLVSLRPGDVVCDIACNDLTLLSFYPNGVIRVGFDPAKNLPHKTEIEHFIHDYFTGGEFPFEGQQARIVTSIAMFYDLPDPVQFTRDVSGILHPDGVWILQLNDLASMIKLNAVDAICHEHLEYYSVSDIMKLVAICGLSVFRIEHNDVNGGSLRFYIAHDGYRHIEKSVGLFLAQDRQYLSSPEGSLEAFALRVQEGKRVLTSWLKLMVDSGSSIYGLAASTKGNTLLQFFDIHYPTLDVILDKNPDKYGTFAIGSMVPIIDEQIGLEHQPDYLLVLAWGFLPFFLKSMKEYMKKGGILIVPLPEPRIYLLNNNEELIEYSLQEEVKHGEQFTG